MRLDALLHHYLGSEDPTSVDDATLDAARDRLLIDFAKEEDAGRRFALWSLMAVLGDAPDPRDAFEDMGTRDAALAFARLLRQNEPDDAA